MSSIPQNVRSASQSGMRSIVFLYPDIASPTIKDIEAGVVPRERLTGFYQVRETGWDVWISDARWTASSAGLRRKLARFIELPNWQTLRDFRQADIIVVKDSFSVLLTTMARLFGKKIVYLDTMFAIPSRWWPRASIRFSLAHADAIVAFSASQARLWSETFGIGLQKFTAAPYCVDTRFYTLEQPWQRSQPPYLLSVGRDLGRDFDTLIDAAEVAGIDVKLVTLPYLLSERARRSRRVEVLERLSYPELFRLYAQASLAVVPLKHGITYPSGIRATLEPMALGIPTIASRTPVLEEYFTDGDDIVLVPPEDPEALAGTLRNLIGDADRLQRLGEHGQRTVRTRFDVGRYGEQLIDILESL
jgi:glycosyltransferase involved in cell wall biosynthesis